jgi:exodeoxyribonuclease VII large subunit
MRGRHVADVTHEIRRAMRLRMAAAERTAQSLRRTLETFDLRRRLGRVRARLVAVDGRLTAASSTSRHRADRLLRGAAARLEALSPLAVLGRGYAVCWNADRTAVIREASAVAPGEQVRVTLAQGELECAVTGGQDIATGRPRSG